MTGEQITDQLERLHNPFEQGYGVTAEGGYRLFNSVVVVIKLEQALEIARQALNPKESEAQAAARHSPTKEAD